MDGDSPASLTEKHLKSRLPDDTVSKYYQEHLVLLN